MYDIHFGINSTLHKMSDKNNILVVVKLILLRVVLQFSLKIHLFICFEEKNIYGKIYKYIRNTWTEISFHLRLTFFK